MRDGAPSASPFGAPINADRRPWNLKAQVPAGQVQADLTFAPVDSAGLCRPLQWCEHARDKYSRGPCAHPE